MSEEPFRSGRRRGPGTLGRAAWVAGVGVALVALALLRPAGAHCDAMDGPIVPAALRALERGDVTPLLRWVRPEDEPTVHAAFSRARAVRDAGDDARALADLWFLETFVRVHRAGEGEPYTGLKPAGTTKPVFAAADAALESGSVDALADELAGAVRGAIVERFEEALERGRLADESVDRGRAFVRAYVRYVHFVEALDELVQHGATHHGDR